MPDLGLEGKWDQLKGKIRSTWGDLTDDDVEQSKGDMEQLMGRIKERTGQSMDDIRRKFDELNKEGDYDYGRERDRVKDRM